MRLTDIERKRLELWGLTLVLLLSCATTVIVLGFSVHEQRVWLISLGILSVLFTVYIVQKERQFHRLEQMHQQEQFKVLEEQALSAALKVRLREMEALHRAAEAAILEKKPEQSLQQILESALELFTAERGSVMLVDEKTQTLLVAVSVGLKPEFKAIRQRVGEGVAGHVAQTGEPLLLNGPPKPGQFNNPISKEAPPASSMCVPLRVRSKTVGVLNCSLLVEASNRRFTENDLDRLALFGRYAAIAIENAQIASGARTFPTG
jgi:transcriptional regulator with GAF, ATPase, and Fis domain